MSPTLAAPGAVQDTPQSLDDETKMVSTTLNPPAHLPPLERPKTRLGLRRLTSDSVRQKQLHQLPLASTAQPVPSLFDRAARDFPDLFILASSY